MKIIMLLVIVLLSACAKTPVVSPATQTPQPTCFAPAGFYMGVAGLEKHNCKVAPKETVVFPLELKENTLSCGVHKMKKQTQIGLVTTIIGASAHALNGRIIVETTECVATYEVVFLRMK